MKPRLTPYLLILLAVVFFYWPSVGHPFHFDDRLFLQDSNVQNGRWWVLLWPPVPRLLSWLTFLVQYQVSGAHPASYHALNIILHALTALLVFQLLGVIFQQAGREVSRLVPLAGALVFALHPLQTESVFYIYQRSTLMGSFFGLLALLAYLKGRHLLTFVFFVLGVASKEFVAVLPLILWMSDGLIKRQWSPAKPLKIFMAMGVACAAAFGAWVLLTEEATFGGSLSEAFSYAATQAKVIWTYVRLVLVPHALNIDHDVKTQENLGDPAWLLAVGSLIVVVWAVIRLSRKHAAAGFFVASFFLFLLPSSSFFPSQDYLFEHRLYASMLGFAGLLCWGLVEATAGSPALRFRPRLAMMAIGFCLLLGSYIRLDLSRRQVWEDEIALWRDAAEKSPHKYRPHYNLGVLLMERSPREAISFLSRAIEIEPGIPLAYRSLGKVYFDLADLSAAERLWKRALALEADDAETQLGLGRLYVKKHDYLRATQHLETAQQLNPPGWQSYYYLCQLNLQFGFLERAVEQCEMGVGRNPNHPGLRFLLADTLAEGQAWERATELYREGLERDPQNSMAHYKLGRAYWELGLHEQAREAVRKGISLSHSQLETSLGESLLRNFSSAKPPDSDPHND